MKGVVSARDAGRRKILRNSAAVLTAGLLASVTARKSHAAKKTLRILRWKHFVPGYDQWFNNEFVVNWGREHDTDVIVDNVGMGELNSLARAEAEAGTGHDLVLHLAPPALFEDFVIDHREVFEECVHRYSDPVEFTRLGTYNLKTRKFYGVCESYAPTVVTYRSDLWNESGYKPDTWENIRKGGRIIKLQTEKPIGLSLAAEHNAKHTLRAMLYAFGGVVQTADGQPSLSSPATLEALKFCKALYRETMRPEVLDWGPASNNGSILSQEGALTVDTLSIPRAAESKSLPVDAQLELARLPAGPAGSVGPNFGQYTYTIWSFSKNIELAKSFIVDLIGQSKHAMQASGFQNMPSFPQTVPDLSNVLTQDPVNPQRYAILDEVRHSMTNLGYPGHSNAATTEVMNNGIVSSMFSDAARGLTTPEAAMQSADKAVRSIYDKWREIGKI